MVGRTSHDAQAGGAPPSKQLYPGATFTVSYFWLYKAYDSFVQGDAPIVEAQMKGGAVNLIQVRVNAPK